MSASVRSLSSSRNVRGLIIGLGVLALTWQVYSWISAGDNRVLLQAGLVFGLLAITVCILRDWRSGFYLFLGWLFLEDLPRKFLGDSMAIYLTKDFLVGVTYVSCLIARRHRQFETFRPPFWRALALFFWLALIQVFNFWAPSLLYGALGMKLYFWYVPLMFVSYALMRTPEDLRRFLMFSAAFGILISCIGVIQATVNINFLNPVNLAPEFVGLGRLERSSPLTHLLVRVPTGVFVSGARFSQYLEVAWIVAVGTLGYFLLARVRGVFYVFLAVGTTSAGLMLCGTREAIVLVAASTLVMTAALLWGTPWKRAQGRRLGKAFQYALLAIGGSLILLVQFAPQSVGANWAFVSETLSPTGAGSQIHGRIVEYPLTNLEKAFNHPRWVVGYGTGTGSLGVQYVAGVLHAPELAIGVENGIGTLIVEMGILGPILWSAWVIALLLSAWHIVRTVRQTAYFPVAFGIFWFAFLLLIPMTYLAMSGYQNFVLNAYLWILVGILFRLPYLASLPQPAPVAPRERFSSRNGFAVSSASR